MKKFKIDRKKIGLFILYLIIGVILSKVNFARIEGSNTYFTFFDFFAPASAVILGLPLTLVAIFTVKLVMFAIDANTTLALFDIVRFVTPLAAVFYFSNKSKLVNIIPVLAIIGFLIHPVGRQAWPFALLWVIPIMVSFFKNKISYLNALGATFTQHALGGLAFIYLVPSTAEFWLGLIPLVLQERVLIAAGIVVFALLLKEISNLNISDEKKIKLKGLN